MISEQLLKANLILLDRVSVTGRQEAKTFVAVINSLELELARMSQPEQPQQADDETQ